MTRKDEALSFAEMIEDLKRLAPDSEDVDGLARQVEASSWYVGHTADPADEGYRRAVQELIKGLARADLAAMGQPSNRSEAFAGSAPKRENPLATALSAEARLDRNAAEFLAGTELFAFAPEVGTVNFLCLLSARELLRSGKMPPRIKEIVAAQTLKICIEKGVSLEQASLIAAWHLLKLPIADRLPSRGSVHLATLDEADREIPYFDPEGILKHLDLLSTRLSQSYSLRRSDVPALIVEGKVARLQEAALRIQEHGRFEVLNTIVLSVPAYIEPSEVAMLYAKARAAPQRPRTLGPRSIELVRRWAEQCLCGGDPYDSKRLMESWNRDSDITKAWRFAHRYRFNDALRLARDRVLKPIPAEREKSRRDAAKLAD